MVFWAIEERGCPCGASWTEADAAFDGEVGKKLGFWRSDECNNLLQKLFGGKIAAFWIL